MPVPVAPDDIVGTAGDAAGNARPPLLVIEPLIAFLDAQGLGEGEPEIAPIGDGHSNVTYAIRRGGRDFVLRRPPRPPLPPSAHDVLREVRVLRALGGRARVPRVLAVCEDPTVIGAPFYAMELIEGVAIGDAVPAALDQPPRRRRIGEELIDALAEIHAVDWRAAGLEGFGRPDGYLERQLRRFIGLWEHNQTRELAAVDAVADWLARNLPASPHATVVHGDYRLGNTIVAATPPVRLLAVLDWEMATIGDPLADLGYLYAFWSDREDPGGEVVELSTATRAPGFPTRAELVARYEERSGRAMDALRWYEAFAVWKAIVFLEGNYKRAALGSTDDAFLRSAGEKVSKLAERAERLVRGAS